MPHDIVGEAFGGILRLVARIFVEIVFEILIRGTGYTLIRPFRKDTDMADGACAIVGVLAWVVIVVGGYALYHYLWA